MFFVFFLYFLLVEDYFKNIEETLKEIRKADAFFELETNTDSYLEEWERIKKENKKEALLKFKEKLDYEFNISLKKKYALILKKIEENLSFFGPEKDLEEYRKFQEEIEMRIESKLNLQNLNYEITEKLKKIYDNFKDPCPEYFKIAENSRDFKTKLENYCKISRNLCLFSAGLKQYATSKLGEEKLKFFVNLREGKNLKEAENLSSLFFNCFGNDKDFSEEVSKLKNETLEELEIISKNKDCKNLEKKLVILRVLGVEAKDFEGLASLCIPEESPLPEKTISRYEEKERDLKIFTSEKEKGEPYIILNVWQSAWGDFRDLDILINYVKRNKISELNLNIGREITEKKDTKVKFREILKNLSDRLYSSGIKKINLLYAELNYPIENYADFLNQNQDLKIDKIVDDSEFTDKNLEKYSINNFSVKKYNLKYSLFVTLEKEGNSGVSDKTRFKLLEEADEVILMSYFSCDLEEQKKWLLPYLKYSEKIGRKGNVKIALLFGSKSVGREFSCEKLSRENLKNLIFELHNWASSNFSSYSGIVFETNKKTPPEIY